MRRSRENGRDRSIFADVYRKGLAEEERKELMWRYVLDHPGYFLGHRVLRNAVHFAAPPRDWWISRGHFPPGEHRTWFWILSALFHVPFYLLLLLRTGRWWKGRESHAFGFLILLYWAYWAEHAITVGGSEVRPGGLPVAGGHGPSPGGCRKRMGLRSCAV